LIFLLLAVAVAVAVLDMALVEEVLEVIELLLEQVEVEHLHNPL
jgi:hypothetical protein